MLDLPDYLWTPVSPDIQAFAKGQGRFSVGAHCEFSPRENSLPDNEKTIVLLSFSYTKDNKTINKNLYELFRKQLYSFTFPNWNIEILDLGEAAKGATYADTLQVLSEIVKEITAQENTQLFLLAPDHSLTYDIIKLLPQKKEINIACIDSRLDLQDVQGDKNQNFVADIFNDSSLSIGDFKLLGYQSYFVAQEELDLLEQLNFTALRLGKIVEDISIAEPELRDSIFTSIDLTSVQYKDFKGVKSTVNGFNSREICAITRYTGLAEELKIIGIFGELLVPDFFHEATLLAEMFWYFAEGVNQKNMENNFSNLTLFEKYMVLQEQGEIYFYKNIRTSKWWLEIDKYTGSGEKEYIPCSERDYIQAKNNQLPEKWWRAFKKNF